MAVIGGYMRLIYWQIVKRYWILFYKCSVSFIQSVELEKLIINFMELFLNLFISLQTNTK